MTRQWFDKTQNGGIIKGAKRCGAFCFLGPPNHKLNICGQSALHKDNRLVIRLATVAESYGGRFVMSKLINEVGNRHGRLLVIKKAGNNKIGAATWLCKCDCGNESVALGRHLRSGHTQSCGCLAREIHSLSPGRAMMRTLIRTYRRRAQQRNLPWKLTEEQFAALTQQSCYYCGIEPRQACSSELNNGSYVYNGIDRVNNKEGYVIGNVVPCCGTCNVAKNDMRLDEFSEWVRRVDRRRPVWLMGFGSEISEEYATVGQMWASGQWRPRSDEQLDLP